MPRRVGVATVRRAEDDIAGQATSQVGSQALRLALEDISVEFVTCEDGSQGVAWKPIEERDAIPV